MEEKELVSVDKDNWTIKIHGVKKKHYDAFMDWCREHVGGKPNIGLHILVELVTTYDKRIANLEQEIELLKQNQLEEKKEEIKKIKSFGKGEKK